MFAIPITDILPIHPPPDIRKGESIGAWIERLAAANHASFLTLLKHVETMARSVGFAQALGDLTGVPVGQITCMWNEFKQSFWDHKGFCPIQDCGYCAKNGYNLSRHLACIHDIGVKWHYCPRCDFKTKLHSHMTNHLVRVHDLKV